jgi:hypothetical protein
MAQMPQWSLRPERADSSRLAWAFAISLLLHLTIFGSYEAGKRLGWWQNIRWPTWLQSPKLLTELLKKKEPPPPEPPVEVPLVFVDVSAAQAVTEPPKKTEYYSDKNSVAANPDTTAATETPKIDGKQTEVVKTEDVPRQEAFPLQPALPPSPKEEPKEEPKTEPKPEPAPAPEPATTPGLLAMAKPEPKPIIKEETPVPKERPRTIEEALARQQQSGRLTGEKMKQEGGVKRHAVVSSLDVRATPFGAYDAAIIAAVQNRWYELLDARNYASDQRGKVNLKFRLHSDGTVSEIKLVEHTVDLALSLLCQSAIQDPAPYAKWPSDMRRLIGADFRDVTFTFFYY